MASNVSKLLHNPLNSALTIPYILKNTPLHFITFFYI